MFCFFNWGRLLWNNPPPGSFTSLQPITSMKPGSPFNLAPEFPSIIHGAGESCNPDKKEASKEGVFSVERACRGSATPPAAPWRAKGRAAVTWRRGQENKSQSSSFLPLNLVESEQKQPERIENPANCVAAAPTRFSPRTGFFQRDSEFGSSGVAFASGGGRSGKLQPITLPQRRVDAEEKKKSRMGSFQKQLSVSESAPRRMKREEANQDKVAGRLKRAATQVTNLCTFVPLNKSICSRGRRGKLPHRLKATEA